MFQSQTMAKRVGCSSYYVPVQEFTICWKDEGDPSQSVVAFYMDGRAVGGKPSARGVMGCNEGVFVSPHKLRPFVFGNIVTTGTL